MAKQKKKKVYIESIPLAFAQTISNTSQNLLTDELLQEKLSPITKELVRFWFGDEFKEQRAVNFHSGQREAILNIIYLFEIKKERDLSKIYQSFKDEIKISYEKILKDKCQDDKKENSDKENDDSKKEEILKNKLSNYDEFIQSEITKDSYNKYAFKMATGTGKTWVMNALIIWQYLNAEAGYDGYIKNFLVIAPGLIVYDRLLESFKSSSADIKQNKDLFVPQKYRNNIDKLLNNVYDKDGISNISDGCIVVVNWHIFLDNEKTKLSKMDELQKEVLTIIPLKPGTSGGNNLEVLDKIKIDAVEELLKLDGLIVISDEAHHIHDEEIVWQQAINRLQDKYDKDKFMQLDFSATPYTVTGGDKNKIKHYFTHTIVDFGLKKALNEGLLKLITLDKIDDKLFENCSYEAIKSEKGLILSEGQKKLLGIGYSQLDTVAKQLEKSGKIPKMMVTVEDTTIIGQVEEFLKDSLGLQEKNILTIHSNKKGEIGEKEYEKLREQLFNLDREDDIKVVLSVLMLKEGFDVNNICVVVPLRATESSILLEQTIGRGLRLMYRTEIPNDQRIKRFKDIVEGKSDKSMFAEDILHIVEHPRFKAFYKQLIQCGEVSEPGGGGGEPPALEVVKLKEDYEKYDMFFITGLPTVMIEPESIKDVDSSDLEIEIDELLEYQEYSLDDLIEIKNGNYEIVSQEIVSEVNIEKSDTEMTKYSRYDYYENVVVEIINEHIIKEHQLEFLNDRRKKQIIENIVYDYIEKKLFGKEFNPDENENFNIFGIGFLNLKKFVGDNVAQSIKEYLQSKKYVGQSYNITKNYFSEHSEYMANSDYLLKLTKTIYEKTQYPSNRGGLEKAFLQKIDKDANVESFVKVMEFKHDFATIAYQNDLGMISNYYPDFLVKTKKYIYIVETKSDRDIKNKDLIMVAKEKAALKYVKKINKLLPEKRDNREWKYVILGEKAVKESDVLLV